MYHIKSLMNSPNTIKQNGAKGLHQPFNSFKIRGVRMQENRLVVADVGWAESIPEWLKDEVKAERMISGFCDLLGKGKKEVGDAEACVYLYTASLRAPMSHELTNVYLYLCTKLMEKRGTEVPKDIALRKLSEYEQNELRELKYKLYTSRGGKIKSPLFDALNKVFKNRGCKK